MVQASIHNWNLGSVLDSVQYNMYWMMAPLLGNNFEELYLSLSKIYRRASSFTDQLNFLRLCGFILSLPFVVQLLPRVVGRGRWRPSL